MKDKQKDTSSIEVENLNVQVGPVEIKDIATKIGEIIDDLTEDITLKW